MNLRHLSDQLVGHSIHFGNIIPLAADQSDKPFQLAKELPEELSDVCTPDCGCR